MASPLRQSDEPSQLTRADRWKRPRRLIILVILISVGAHLIFGVGAGIWVIAKYLAKPQVQFVAPRKVEMKPEEREHRRAMDEVSSLRPKPVYDNRITSLRPTQLSLPELPKMPKEAMVPLETQGMVTEGLGGAGQGGQGNGAGAGFFGGAGNLGNGLLEGTLYDLKLNEKGKPTNIDGKDLGRSIELYRGAVAKLVAAGMRSHAMRGYFEVPKKLYLGQLNIPAIPAGDAPRAFESNIKPSYWVIVYRGLITPPKDGAYRFAGSADDVIIVRINNRVVMEGSLIPARITGWDSRDKASLRGGWGKEFGEASTHVLYGDWVTMKAGQYYPIEILIGEIPGSVFYANLYVQEKGVSYASGPDGKPVLPLFRLQVNLPKVPNSLRPVADDGPIFKAITNRPASGGGL